MKITEIQTDILRLPHVQANGDGLQDVLLIRIHTDEGIVGIGEAHTVPTVLKAIIDAPVSQSTGQGLAQLLIGRDPRQINALWSLMYDCSATYGRRGVVVQAISGIDIALWDILGKVCGQPIHRLLGGGRRDRLRAYASDLSPETPDEIVSRACRHVADGFTALKFGWGGLGASVRDDAAYVERVRAAVPEEVDIMLDMGTPIPFEEALWLADALAEYRVAFLEEPLSPDDLDGFAALTARARTPIATGEKETTRFGFRDLVERGGLRIIQPDIARCGGITEMLRIAALAELRGVTVIPHCWATDILVSATAQVLATLPSAPYLEFNATDNPLRRRLTSAPICPVDGHVRVSDAPGLGLELNEDTIAEFRWSP